MKRKPTEAEELASLEAEKERKVAMDELSNIEIKDGDYQIQGFFKSMFVLYVCIYMYVCIYRKC